MADYSIQERIQKRLLGITKQELQTQLSKRYNEGYADGYNDGGEDEPVEGTLAKKGYRQQSSTMGRNFNLAGFKEILQIAWNYYQSSPVAKRILTIKRDYIMGNGIFPRCDDESANEVIQEFWKENKLDVERAKEFVMQLFLLGSQIYTVFVRKTDGRVMLGYIDPEEIEMVVTNPHNSMDQWAVIIGEQNSSLEWETPQGKKAYRIIRKDDGFVEQVNGEDILVNSQNEGRLVTADQVELEDWEKVMLDTIGLREYSGSCFYTKVNSVSNHPYGYSDLAQVLDWIDQLDAVLFALADRERMADYFSFDVAVEGDAEQVLKRSNELRKDPPKKGSANVHSIDETWTLHSPMLHQAQSVETVNALITFILGGEGYPRHWYGHGDYTNRATAEAQESPSLKSLEHDQTIVKNMFLTMCQFAVDQAIIAGGSGISEDYDEIHLDMPQMSIKDVSAIAGIFHNILFAMGAAMENRWITQDTAMKVIQRIMEEMGVPYDPIKEKEEIGSAPLPLNNEPNEPEKKTNFNTPPNLVQTNAQNQQNWLKRLATIQERYIDSEIEIEP